MIVLRIVSVTDDWIVRPDGGWDNMYCNDSYGLWADRGLEARAKSKQVSSLNYKVNAQSDTTLTINMINYIAVLY